MVTFHCGTPSDSAASRIWLGTSRSISSVVRTTTGSTISASASAPAQPEKCPHVRDAPARRRTGRCTIDGADSRMSLTKRIDLAEPACRGRIRRARCRPARRSACRSAIAEHAHHEAAEQRIEQAAVRARRRRHLVNSARLSRRCPWRSVVHRIQTSQNRPNTVASAATGRGVDACGARGASSAEMPVLMRPSCCARARAASAWRSPAR